jgi:nucleolar protein 6
LHHSLLDGRRINLELTSGGGGSSEKRKEAIKARNRALEEEREWVSNAVTHLMKSVSPLNIRTLLVEYMQKRKSQGEDLVTSSNGQRHSTTSGAEIADPSKVKTWSVPTSSEKAGRGGKRHVKKQQRGQRGEKSKSKKAWAPSGANAVSVG